MRVCFHGFSPAGPDIALAIASIAEPAGFLGE